MGRLIFQAKSQENFKNDKCNMIGILWYLWQLSLCESFIKIVSSNNLKNDHLNNNVYE